MLRQIITPLEQSFTLQLPSEMLGKTVEIIAFEIKEPNNESINTGKEKSQRLDRIKQITRNTLVDLSKFKFNRDEANNYEA